MLGLGSLPACQRRCTRDWMYQYEKLEKIGEGAYAVVYKARDRLTNETVAVKKMKLYKTNDGIPANVIREISILKELKHDNIIRFKEVVLNGELYLVFEYMEDNLQNLINSCPELAKDPYRIKKILYQILCGIAYCHSRRILHRDLKPNNILIDRQTNVLKLADFGLSRAFNIPIQMYTHEVVTMNYKSPELLLRSDYSTPLDVWSIGCIFAELVNRIPLFYGDSEIGQLFAIFKILGTPDEETWPGFTSLPEYKCTFPKWLPQDLATVVPNLEPVGIDLLTKMLRYDPSKRITACDALKHTYFADLELAPPP